MLVKKLLNLQAVKNTDTANFNNDAHYNLTASSSTIEQKLLLSSIGLFIKSSIFIDFEKLNVFQTDVTLQKHLCSL